jgi:two-component system response regulator FixJ
VAKRSTKQESQQVFLIVSDRKRCSALAKELRADGLKVEEYQTAREFLIDKVNHQGGVVVASVRLMELGGIELANTLKGEAKAFPVILMAGHADSPAAVKSGAEFVNDLSPDNILAAVRRVTTPETFQEKGLRWGFEKLSERESAVLALIANGLSSREISAEMGIAFKTVESHRARINERTRASDVAELLRMWKAWKALG